MATDLEECICSSIPIPCGRGIWENPYRFSPGESVLLLDESLIESEKGVRRRVIPGKKIPFVMEPDEDKPWEFCGPGMTRTIHLYGTTLYDQAFGKYRMW